LGNATQREHEFVGWIRTQRQIYRERMQTPVVVAPAEAVQAAVRDSSGSDAREVEGRAWLRRVPDELIVGAAVLGACIGCPIGSAEGLVLGFLGGLAGALLGAMAVLAMARLMKLLAGAAALGLLVLVAYAILHAARR
jgi:hypothetical protein